MAGANFSGGGQGDDVLGAVDAMIDGRVPQAAKKSRLGADGKPIKDPTVFQQLRDGLASIGILGQGPNDRRKADNAAIRGAPASPGPQQPGQPAPSNPTIATVNPDGSPINSSRGFLDGILHSFGKIF